MLKVRDLSGFMNVFTIQEKIRISLWVVFSKCFVMPFVSTSRVRIAVLRLFGAQIQKGVVIRPSVRVYFPWNLAIGENSWIGEGVWIINHVPVEIGSNVCVSQLTVICSSSHNYKSTTLQYKHKSVLIKDGAWVGLRCTILPGTVIGANSVISGGETLSAEIPDYHLFKNQRVWTLELE